MNEQYIFPEHFPFLATCHLDGCENAEIPIDVFLTSQDALVICGPCGTHISDIQSLQN